MRDQCVAKEAKAGAVVAVGLGGQEFKELEEPRFIFQLKDRINSIPVRVWVSIGRGLCR